MTRTKITVQPGGCKQRFDIWVHTCIFTRLVNSKNPQSRLKVQSTGHQRKMWVVCEFSYDSMGNIKITRTNSPDQLPIYDGFGNSIDRFNGIIFNPCSDCIEVGYHNGSISGKILPIE